MNKSAENIFSLLKEISDPEIPVLNIVEMGIVQKVDFIDEEIIISITPTYSGCPAMKMIEAQIKEILSENNISDFNIKTIYSPVWTTDWLSEETKKKLENYGISAPEKTENINVLKSFHLQKVHCPYCKSADTKLTSEFGSTACKSLHYCNKCCQPFEHFKCI